MPNPVLPADPFATGPVRLEHIPACPCCGGGLRPWGPWRAAGGQLADCRSCRSLHGVVLLPTVRYVMVDATEGVWHASAHPLPPEAQHPDLVAGREREPPAESLAPRAELGDPPQAMLGDWCRLVLGYHWERAVPPERALAFLLVFREEDLSFDAASPIPTGGPGRENPDSDLAPGAFRLRCGVALLERLTRSDPGACWQALDTHHPTWLPRTATPRGHNLLAPLFLRSPMPATVSPELAAFVEAKFPFRPR